MKDKEYELLSELAESSEKSFKKLFMNYHDTLFRFVCYKVKETLLNMERHIFYNSYSSSIKIKEISMYHFNGVYKNEFLISWRRGELNSRPK